MEIMGMTRASRRPGFTLVELLVVVSIIALLLAILLPSLRKARSQAKRVVCGCRLKQLGLAHTTYALEHNGVLIPNGLGDDGSWPLWYLDVSEGGAFAPYWAGHKSTEEPLLTCPSDRDPYPREKQPEMDHKSQSSYGLNSWAKRVSAAGATPRVYERWGAGGNQLSRFRQPAGTMLMAEIWRWHSIIDRDAVETGTWDAHFDPHETQPDRYPGNLEWDDRERHEGILNFLYVDNHVETRAKARGVPTAKKDPTFWGPGYDRKVYEDDEGEEEE
jgi:prepilin-type N-terminal cleavage/methylation domain-containing protein